MEKKLYDNCVEILKEELIAAMGCTEPIAIAFVSALARKTLGSEPVSCEVLCSGNIVKNVMGVVVPNSQGQRGIAVAACSDPESIPRERWRPFWELWVVIPTVNWRFCRA